MPRYEWKGDGDFHDRLNDRVVEPGEVAEFSEETASEWSELVMVEEDTTPDMWEQAALHDLEWSELRGMAVDAETDAINGKSSKDEIVSYFVGREK